jgi:hypothetical protein
MLQSIADLRVSVAEIASTQKVMFGVFAVVASLVAIAGTVVGIGKALDWF